LEVRRPDGVVLGWGARFPDGVVVVHWRDGGGTEIFGGPPSVGLLRSSSGEPGLVLRWHSPSGGSGGSGGAAGVLTSALHRADRPSPGDGGTR
jgi:hypothetical protein